MDGNVNSVIDKRIEEIVKRNNIFHLGKVTKINNYIIEASGLDDAFFFEKVIIGSEENIGYIEKIDESKVYISLVKTDGNITIGTPITSTGEPLQALFSMNSMGMIIDPFGLDRMSGRKFNDSKVIDIESPYIPIMDRTPVNRPLETGIAAIDLMFPIGKGQRQLIIGDKKLGKTQLCLDTIVNQKGKDVYCIYVSIGKTKKELKRLYTKLTEKQANHYTLIVAAFNDDPAPLVKLTPYVALSIAQEFMKEGKDVLVCIDDLKKHADACREIALISEKNTGRDAYPADIFYTHSRLLEKGCQYKSGGSITILPVVETKSGDITDYISTNIISITDGQIVLSDKLFKKGQKPAINYGLSVSRLGGAVQRDDIKKIGSAVRRKLLSYLETADVYQLVNIESLSDELQDKLYKGQELMRLLNQRKFSPISQDRLVELFGYTVGMGESTAVKELLKYVEKSNEIEGDGLVKPAPKSTKTTVEKREEIKVDTPVLIPNNETKEEPVVQQPEEPKVSIEQMKNDDSFELNFFQSVSDVDNDFDKDAFNKNDINKTVEEVKPAVPSAPVAPVVAPAPVVQQPVVPPVQEVKPVAPSAPVAPVVTPAPVVQQPVIVKPDVKVIDQNVNNNIMPSLEFILGYNKVLEKKPEGKVELPSIENILAPAKNVIVKKQDTNAGMPSISQLLGREYNENTKPVTPVVAKAEVKPVVQNTVVNKPVAPVVTNTEVKPVVQNTVVNKPVAPVANTEVKPVVQNTVVKPVAPVVANTEVKPVAPVVANKTVTAVVQKVDNNK